MVILISQSDVEQNETGWFYDSTSVSTLTLLNQNIQLVKSNDTLTVQFPSGIYLT